MAFVAREWTAKLGLVAAGLGVAVVPGLAAAAVREDVALVRVRADAPATRRVAVVTSAEREPSPTAEALIEVLERVGAALTAEVHERVDRR